MKSEKGRQYHQNASVALESGDFLKALTLEDEAMIAYQTDGDEAGFSEIQAMRLLTLNMLGDSTGDKRYYTLAMHTALAGLDLAEATKIPEQIALAHGAVGRAMDRAEKFEEAASHFDKAVELLSANPSDHSRKSIIADFRNHSATSRISAGKLDEEAKALKAIEDLLASGDSTDYELKVWHSGGLMRLAMSMYRNGKKEEAAKYLTQAEEVANSNQALKVRREQIAKLRQMIAG